MLASSVTLEFVLGCLLARVWLTKKQMFQVNGWLPIMAGVIALLANEHGFWPDLIGRGVPSTVIVFGFLCLDYRQCSFPKWLVVGGDASYSIYLFHMPFIAIWIQQPLALRHIHSGNGYTTDLLIVFSVMTSVLAGVILHSLIERPLHQDLTRRYCDFVSRSQSA